MTIEAYCKRGLSFRYFERTFSAEFNPNEIPRIELVGLIKDAGTDICETSFLIGHLTVRQITEVKKPSSFFVLKKTGFETTVAPLSWKDAKVVDNFLHGRI